MIEFYTRQGCHLCDEAMAAVRRLGISVAVIDIDVDDRHLAEFDHRVPVIRNRESGEVLAEGVVGEPELRAALGDWRV